MIRLIASTVLACTMIVSAGSVLAHGEKALHPHIFSIVYTDIEEATLEHGAGDSVGGVIFTGTTLEGTKRRVRIYDGLSPRIEFGISGQPEWSYIVSKITIWDTCPERGMPEYASIHGFVDENQNLIDLQASVYVGLSPCEDN